MDKPIFNNNFWNIVKKIDQLTEKVNINQFVSEFSSSEFGPELIYDVLEFLDELNFHVQIEEVNGEHFLIPNIRNEKIQMEFSFSQWIALQAHFPLMKQFGDYEFQKSLEKKFAEVNAKYPDYNLYGSSIDEEVSYNFKSNLSKKFISYVDTIEEAFQKNGLVLINIENNTYEIFPHKLIMLEGELTIIGEETQDRCLISYTLGELSNVKFNPINDYSVNYSRFEVDEFVMAIRAVSGREERLVLKIDQDVPVDLNPAYQFMGHPYMTSNPEGDFIWAASVEVSSELYDWIISMGKSIEILDPLELKSEFEKYREVKLDEMTKKSLKKAA